MLSSAQQSANCRLWLAVLGFCCRSIFWFVGFPLYCGWLVISDNRFFRLEFQEDERTLWHEICYFFCLESMEDGWRACFLWAVCCCFMLVIRLIFALIDSKLCSWLGLPCALKMVWIQWLWQDLLFDLRPWFAKWLWVSNPLPIKNFWGDQTPEVKPSKQLI